MFLASAGVGGIGLPWKDLKHLSAVLPLRASSVPIRRQSRNRWLPTCFEIHTGRAGVPGKLIECGHLAVCASWGGLPRPSSQLFLLRRRWSDEWRCPYISAINTTTPFRRRSAMACSRLWGVGPISWAPLTTALEDLVWPCQNQGALKGWASIWWVTDWVLISACTELASVVVKTGWPGWRWCVA